MEIVKVYKETFPSVKLVGKRYTNNDRDETGTFGHLWQECFKQGWYDTLKKCNPIPNGSDDLVGAMRMTGADNCFEYWIGMFVAFDAQVPEGFESIEIPAGDVGVCWLCGNDKSGELYGMEASDLCMEALAQKGYKISEDGWFYERYNNIRFTTPNKNGDVVLDICAYLAQ